MSGGVDGGDVHIQHTPRPFDLVSRNLRFLGALSIEDFLSSPIITDTKPDVSQRLFDNATAASSSVVPSSAVPQVLARLSAKPDSDTGQPSSSIAVKMQTVARLHQTCQRVFGSSDALKFGFLEERGPNSTRLCFSLLRTADQWFDKVSNVS